MYELPQYWNRISSSKFLLLSLSCVTSSMLVCLSVLPFFLNFHLACISHSLLVWLSSTLLCLLLPVCPPFNCWWSLGFILVPPCLCHPTPRSPYTYSGWSHFFHKTPTLTKFSLVLSYSELKPISPGCLTSTSSLICPKMNSSSFPKFAPEFSVLVVILDFYI